jgi:asparaginyl-tRNA synthetase
LNFLLESDYEKILDKVLKVCGWIREMRIHSSKEFAFIEVNDGSTVKNLQIIIDKKIKNFSILNEEIIGASFECMGKIVKTEKNKHSVIINKKYMII